MKNSFLKNSFISFLNSLMFKCILFLLIIMSYLVVSNCKGTDIFSSLSLVFGNHIFIALCMLPMFLFITNYVCTIFDKNIYSIVRFETKEKYYMELIKNVIFFTSVIFLVTLMMVIIVENIINDYGYHVFYDDIVHCYNYVYMIFVIVKFYLFSVLISVINTLLIKSFNSKIIIVLNFILYAFVFYVGSFISLVGTINGIPIFIGNYLISGTFFETFLNEVFANGMMIFILLLVCFILFRYIKKRKRDID